MYVDLRGEPFRGYKAFSSMRRKKIFYKKKSVCYIKNMRWKKPDRCTLNNKINDL